MFAVFVREQQFDLIFMAQRTTMAISTPSISPSIHFLIIWNLHSSGILFQLIIFLRSKITLSFINIRAKGCELLEKANPFITRFRKGKRNKQMGKFYKQVHDKCTAGNRNDLIQDAFNRLRNRVD